MPKSVSESDLVETFLDKSSYEYDGKLATASLTLIAALLFLLGNSIQLNRLVAMFLAISIISLTISFLLLVWYKPRLTDRQGKWKNFIVRRVSEMKDDIHIYGHELGKKDFSELFLRKLLESEVKGKKITKEDLKHISDETMSELEKQNKNTPESKSESIITNLFYKSFVTDLLTTHKQLYFKPLEESNSKLKFYLDMISWKTRYHFFVIGLVLLVMSVVTKVFSLN